MLVFVVLSLSFVLGAVLCVCLKQARDQRKPYNQLERRDSGKELDIGCLKVELQ